MRKAFQNDLRKKTVEVNKLFRAMTQRRGWGYIDNGIIDPSTHLEYDGVHLNANGAKLFASLLSAHIDCVPMANKPSIISSQLENQASCLYEDITSPPARRQYADVVAQRSAPNNSERHWSQVRRWSMPSTGEPYIWNASNSAYQQPPMNSHSSYSGCFNCGEQNHKRANCRYYGKLICKACGCYGHKSNNCTAITQQR